MCETEALHGATHVGPGCPSCSIQLYRLPFLRVSSLFKFKHVWSHVQGEVIRKVHVRTSASHHAVIVIIYCKLLYDSDYYMINTIYYNTRIEIYTYTNINKSLFFVQFVICYLFTTTSDLDLTNLTLSQVCHSNILNYNILYILYIYYHA